MREATDPSTPRGSAARRPPMSPPSMTDDIRTAGSPEDGDAMRDLARHLADATDTNALLRTLLDDVVRQCRAAGASVSHVGTADHVILAASGTIVPVRGTTFALIDSIAERAIAQRDPLCERVSADARDAMSDWARRSGIGEVVVAPLFAAGTLVGLLSAWRQRAAATFDESETRHLGTIAAYAAVALHKQALIEESHAAALAKSSFLAAVSHELRTPLTTLSGYGELLAEGIVGELSSAQQDIVERMRSVTHQLSALIDEILTYSSLEADRERIRLRRVQTIELVRAAAAAAEPLAAQKGIAFRVSLVGELPLMTTDPEKVRQILVNLLGNAVKFTDAGTVTLSADSDGDEVRFIVADTGAGMDPADHARLFQPFVQLDGGLTRRHGGTGLGLYISRRLASLLGGRIDVESALGEGSTFTVTLPVESR